MATREQAVQQQNNQPSHNSSLSSYYNKREATNKKEQRQRLDQFASAALTGMLSNPNFHGYSLRELTEKATSLAHILLYSLENYEK